MCAGNIIILNGVSSAGKTTLAKTLQNRLSQPYFNMDVDVFARMAPSHGKFYVDNNYSIQWEFASNMFHSVKLFSDMGFNLIVPVIFFEGNPLNKCVTILHGYPVLFVHVECPVEELRRREKERGDREIGMAENLLSVMNSTDTYDIKVNTYLCSAEECADRIIKKLNDCNNFTAFENLWAQMKLQL